MLIYIHYRHINWFFKHFLTAYIWRHLFHEKKKKIMVLLKIFLWFFFFLYKPPKLWGCANSSISETLQAWHNFSNHFPLSVLNFTSKITNGNSSNLLYFITFDSFSITPHLVFALATDFSSFFFSRDPGHYCHSPCWGLGHSPEWWSWWH